MHGWRFAGAEKCAYLIGILGVQEELEFLVGGPIPSCCTQKVGIEFPAVLKDL